MGPNELNFIYNCSFEYPYGDIRIELMYDTAGKGIDDLDLKPIPEDEAKNIK